MFGLYFSEYLSKNGIIGGPVPWDVQCLDFDPYIQALVENTGLSPEEVQRHISDYQNADNLSDEDLSALKSGNIDMIVPFLFHFDPAEEIEKNLLAYQKDSRISNSQLNELKREDLTGWIVPEYIQTDPRHANYYLSVFLKTLFRYTGKILIKKPSLVSEYSFSKMVLQRLRGSQNYLAGLAGEGGGLCLIAGAYSGRTVDEWDEYAADCISELINCINGMFASEMSNENLYLEIDVPCTLADKKLTSNSPMICMPLKIAGQEIDFVFSVNADIDIEALGGQA